MLHVNTWKHLWLCFRHWIKGLNNWLQVAGCCQKYSDYERQEVPTQFSTPVLDIIEVINLLYRLVTNI